jgi:hypothetical protein
MNLTNQSSITSPPETATDETLTFLLCNPKVNMARKYSGGLALDSLHLLALENCNNEEVVAAYRSLPCDFQLTYELLAAWGIHFLPLLKSLPSASDVANFFAKKPGRDCNVKARRLIILYIRHLEQNFVHIVSRPSELNKSTIEMLENFTF